MTKKKLTSAAEAKIAEVLAADDATVVELARRMGPEVLRFLDHIMRGNQAALELVQPVPLGLRLAAADLVRKYSSLPTNVDLRLKGPPQIIYTGDVGMQVMLPAEVVDATATRTDRPTLFREGVDADPEAVVDPSDD